MNREASRSRRSPRAGRALLLGAALAPFACDGVTIALYRGDGGATSAGQGTQQGGAGVATGGARDTPPLGGGGALGGESSDAGSGGTPGAAGNGGGASGADTTSGGATDAGSGGATGAGCGGATSAGTGGAAGDGGQPSEPLCDPRPLTAAELACARSAARPGECSMVTSTGFRGCRGTGCSVCRDALFDYPYYAAHHPCCDLSSTCDGDFYPCSSFCPAPELWDRLPKCEDP